MIHPHLLAIARGQAPADLLLTGAQVVNVFTGTIGGGAANVAIHLGPDGGRIAGVGNYSRAKHTIDLQGSYLAPGFIDAHMHVESTMLPPCEFIKLAAPHGTTGVILDPHEIANVLGLPGIRFIMDAARGLPLNFLFALSSCVPCSHLETSGAKLDAADLGPLFDDPRVVALAEMMNFPGVVNADPAVLAKVELGLRRRIVDGHAPGLCGPALQAYAAAGISSDHECTTREEALEKLAAGLRIFIREGSAARNLDALFPAITESTRHRFCFCTDDRHPADLKHEGHIDHIVRRAIALGLPPAAAIAMASINTAQHYRLRDRGAIAPGYWADMIIFDDPQDLRPRQVYYEGQLIAENGRYLPNPCPNPCHWSDANHPSPTKLPNPSVGPVSLAPLRLPHDLSESSFQIPSRSGAPIRVIGMHPHQLTTDSLVEPARPDRGLHTADPSRDLLKLAIIERHRATGNIGLAFVRGFALREGALASTVAHDSHNLTIVGANDPDMLTAARALESCGGGQCVVRNGKVLALLPLPIAGLMSDQPADTVIAQQRQLLDAAHSLGCPHADPFMPLSFLSLPVIPKLKLTDLGLVDVEQFKIVPLEVD